MSEPCAQDVGLRFLDRLAPMEGQSHPESTIAHDEIDLDRPDKKAEDHVCDEVRYRVREIGNRTSSGTTIGMF
ncbi:MAG: hypothetical protein KJZ75_04215 [Hyphomonadaceae bacterium]|nr:hypothetical protein [Hyphomonadaceae bacterium]